MKVGAHSGGLGDIIFAIPVMRRLNITTVYVKKSYYFEPYGDMYKAIERLLTQQGFIVLPTEGKYPPNIFDPLIKFDYNLDGSRKEPQRNRNHIIISYLNHYRLKHNNWTDPWLNITGENNIQQPYSLIHLTPRWRTHSIVDWKKVLHEITGDVYFIGFQHEWVEFCTRYGNVRWLPCNDVLDMAILVRDCEKLYCNQSVSLSLAQGMGKEYHCEFKPGKTNCMMYTKNEHKL